MQDSLVAQKSCTLRASLADLDGPWSLCLCTLLGALETQHTILHSCCEGGQNYDSDLREQVLARGHMIVGTLGCFVHMGTGTGFLSNNHVVAAENKANGGDTILQAGSHSTSSADSIGALHDFERLLTSPAGGNSSKKRKPDTSYVWCRADQDRGVQRPSRQAVTTGSGA